MANASEVEIVMVVERDSRERTIDHASRSHMIDTGKSRPTYDHLNTKLHSSKKAILWNISFLSVVRRARIK